jgi:hypothetical protein
MDMQVRGGVRGCPELYTDLVLADYLVKSGLVGMW